MAILDGIKGFFRAFRSRTGMNPSLKPSSSLARTLDESTHVRGGSQGAGLPRAGTEQQHEIVVEGHENYDKSFKKKDH